MKTLLTILLSLLACGTLYGQTPVMGTWDGAIKIMGTELKIAVTFHAPADTPAATIDIPQQSAMGLPLTNVIRELPRVHFELPAGPGLAIFEGNLKADSITGVFTQAGMPGTFYLRQRPEGKASKPIEEAVPYKHEEVTFKNGSITLAGTLTLPPSGKKHPAVVMITGSGPQNRDEEIFGFKPFKLIADALTRQGVAVLRYDDRGVGGSGGGSSNPTTEDFAGDALAALQYLKTRNDINPAQIGLCGHSEGAVAAPIAATRTRDVAFLVLLAGPGVPGDTLILWQMTNLARKGGASEAEVAEAVQLQHRIYDAVRTGQGWEEVRASMAEQMARSMEQMTPEQRKVLGDSAKVLNARVDGSLQTAKSPWFKYFISYDPVPALEKVRCPVLALYGGLDQQVPPDLTMPPLKEALARGGNKDVTVRVIPKANHLFQEATTGHPSEYVTLKKEFIPGFLDTLSNWVAERVAAR